jgi:hypothetical protein
MYYCFIGSNVTHNPNILFIRELLLEMTIKKTRKIPFFCVIGLERGRKGEKIEFKIGKSKD